MGNLTASRIAKTPDVCGGEACVRQTRIPVWLLVSLRRQGVPDPQLLRNFPSLGAEDLEAAWDYSIQHVAEIEDAIAENEAAED